MQQQNSFGGFQINNFFFSFGRNVPGKTDPMDGVEGIAEKVSFLS
jgi:hypothetical protein